jgi:Secretion system C-terminal sorting domain
MKRFTPCLFAVLFLFLANANVSAQAFWSEDFDGQLPADWTAIMAVGNGNATSNWNWTTTGPAGGFSIGALASTSAANGWMIFDSDLNCSGAQDVWLVSPKLNLTGHPAVFLQFETHYRRFNDETYIMVSTDSITWTQVPIFDGYANGEFADGTTVPADAINPFTALMNLSTQAGNKPQFWFAFRFLADASTVQGGTDIGCGYSWQIDDVALLDADPTPAINIALGDFFFPPASYAQPVSQIKSDTMGFFADLSNIGTATATNVILVAEVRKGNNLLWTDSLLIPAIDTSVTDSTFFIASQFIPENLTVANDYSIRYRVYSQDGVDAQLSNNTAQEGFVVTNLLFAKEAGATTAYRPGGDPSDWAVANVYQTSKNWVDQYKATTAVFQSVVNAADGPLAGKQVTVVLSEVNDDIVDINWDGFDDSEPYASNDGLILRSVNIYEFTQNNNNSTVTLDLVDFETEEPGVVLGPGKRYVLTTEYQGDGNTVIFHGFSENISYFQISTLVFTDQWFLGGFGPEPAAVLRMNIDLYSISDEIALPDNSLNFYPNPASTKLNVDIDLDQPTLANVTIADLNGRVIQIDEIENAYKQSRNYDVSSLPDGIYLVRIATKAGTKTKKFVVQH